MRKQTTPPICNYCNTPAKCVDSREVYRRWYGWLWLCKPCDAYVGCHGQTKQPLGRLANKELREAKKAAHAAFDPLWQRNDGMSRTRAYRWLAESLGLTLAKAHIGMFDVDQCRRVVELCEARQAERSATR